VGTGWALHASLGPGNSLLSFPQVSLSENVVFTTAVTGFATSLNQHWRLSFSGCLAITTTTPGATVLPPVSSLRLQWAPGKNGPWHTISSSIRATGSLCSHGQRFTGTASAPYNYAYYRATFLAAPVPSGYHVGFHAANSNMVLAWKYADRIAGLSVSPTTVSRNGKITVKGTLQYYNSGWRTYAGQTIMIVLEPAGGSTWYWIVKVHTNSTGQFAATVADPVTAHWGPTSTATPPTCPSRPATPTSGSGNPPKKAAYRRPGAHPGRRQLPGLRASQAAARPARPGRRRTPARAPHPVPG
jgi:hypothetical protein